MLRLEGVNAGYGSTTVLRDVSLWVPASSVVALLGPNGAGKTTLLRLASGLIRASAGRITIEDEDVTRCGAYELTKHGICHVPEGRGVFPNLTVRDNIVVQATGKDVDAPARPTGRDDERRRAADARAGSCLRRQPVVHPAR